MYLNLWRRARDSNPQGPRGPVDFKSTALPVEASPPYPRTTVAYYRSSRASSASSQAPTALRCRLTSASTSVGTESARSRQYVPTVAPTSNQAVASVPASSSSISARRSARRSTPSSGFAHDEVGRQSLRGQEVVDLALGAVDAGRLRMRIEVAEALVAPGGDPAGQWIDSAGQRPAASRTARPGSPCCGSTGYRRCRRTRTGCRAGG